MKKITILLMLLTIFSKISGFIRSVSLSYFFGTSSLSDAYVISLSIPKVIFAVIGVGVSTSFIPIYNKIHNEKDKIAADEFTSNIINLLLVIGTLLVALCLMYTESIVKIFASGFMGETLSLAITFTKVSAFSIYGYILIYVLKSYLQINSNYISSVIMGLPSNFVLILSMALGYKYNLLFLSLGSIIAIFIQCFFLMPSIMKNRYKHAFKINIHDVYVRQMIRLSVPVIVGVSVDQVNTLVDKTLASRLSYGGITALNYANELNLFVLGVVVSSVTIIIYPLISKLVSKNDIKGLKKILEESICITSLLVIPATIGAMVFAEQVVSLLFGRGAFDYQSITLTSKVLFFYSIGMIGVGLREVISKVFYSMQDTMTPMINATIGMVLNIILNIVLSRYIGIGGLALATSIAAIFTTGLMFISLRKKIGPFGMKQISISFLKILFASLVMGALAKLSFNYLIANVFSQNISLIIAIGIGALIYFTIIYFMKIDDVDVIINAVKNKLKRNKSHA